MQRIGYPWGAHARKLAVPIIVWAVWGAMTAATILFIWHYARNIPYMDDFALVPVMTGHEPASLSLDLVGSTMNTDQPSPG